VMVARVVQWAGVALTAVSSAVPRKFDDFLRRVIDESDEQVRCAGRHVCIAVCAHCGYADRSATHTRCRLLPSRPFYLARCFLRFTNCAS